MPEAVQKDGEDGLELTKRWLESTTWIELPFDSYVNEPVCSLERLDGQRKVFDAFGSIHTDPPAPLYIENKAYNGVGKQPAEYWEFLANAYSTTAKTIKDTGRDPRFEYMWITTHPFEQTAWPMLTSPERIKEALERDPGALGEDQLDLNLLSKVAERVWLLVLHRRQGSLMLSPTELSQVEAVLNRKGKK